MTDDLGVRFQFNTIVSALMELANALGDLPGGAPHRGPVMQFALERFVLLLSPVAPHLAEQLWHQLGKEGFCMLASWPTADPDFMAADAQVVVVQVNGKVRARITLPTGSSEDQRRTAALSDQDVRHWIDGKEIVKVILPPGGKLVNVVVKV
jgi:leucyl-tRNA synthetase